MSKANETATTNDGDNHAFQADTAKLLHLLVHSVYSDKDIFLRELISNASDAINKVRFDALANADKLEGNTDWKIKLTPDATADTEGGHGED